MRRMNLYTSGSTLVVKCLIFRPYGSISWAIIVSDKDKTVFTMKVEDNACFLESGSKMEWSQKKRTSVVGWMYRTKLDGLEQSPAFQEMVEA